MKKLFYKKGFTLVELLVVIAIIGILSTLLLLQLNTARSRARDAKRVSDITQIRTALEQYFEEGNKYVADGELYTDTAINKYFSTGTPPTDPQGGDKYKYHANSFQNKYQIIAQLENKTSATLNSDSDIKPGDWTGAEDGTVETCSTTTTPKTDCVFDLGIK